MFKYFSKSNSLSEVFIFMKENNDNPRVVISDLEFLFNKKKSTIVDEFIKDPLTIDFFVVDNVNLETMQDDLSLDSVIDNMYQLNISNTLFFKKNQLKIKKINNLIQVIDKANTYLKNNFIYDLINDDFYSKSFSQGFTFYLLFSSVPALIDFVCKFNIYNDTCIILKPEVEYNLEKIETLNIFFEFVLKKFK